MRVVGTLAPLGLFWGAWPAGVAGFGLLAFVGFLLVELVAVPAATTFDFPVVGCRDGLSLLSELLLSF